MPVMDIENVDAPALTELEIRSYMLYPEDEARRDQFLTYFHANATFESLEEAGEKAMKLPISTLKTLLSIPISEDFEREHVERYLEGIIAGKVFLLYVEMLNDTNIKDASIKKAKKIAVNYYKFEAVAPNGLKSKRSTESYISDMWSKYKSVSHLWAGRMFLMEFYENTDELAKVNEENPLVFASIGKALLAYHDLHNKSLLTKSEMWQLPDSVDIPGIVLTCYGLPDTDREFIKANYKNSSNKAIKKPNNRSKLK